MVHIALSMVSICNMFTWVYTWVYTSAYVYRVYTWSWSRAGKLTFAKFKSHFTKWWTMRWLGWQIVAASSKKISPEKQFIGTLWETTYCVKWATFVPAWPSNAPILIYLSGGHLSQAKKNSRAEALSKVTRKMPGWEHWNKNWEQWNGKLILNPSYWTVSKACLL